MSTLKMQEKRVAAPSLLDLPLDVANLVLEKIKSEDRLVSRKVCRNLKAAIDKLGIGFKSIVCSANTDGITLTYFHWNFSYESIGYKAADNGGTLVTHNKKCKLIEENNFVNVALEDMKILMNSQRISNSLFDEDSSGNFVPYLIDFFKTEDCSQVESLVLKKFKFDDVISILECLSAKDPEDIEILYPDQIDNFERITHLEKWKNVKKLDFCDFNSELIHHFFHFPEFNIYKTSNFSPEIAVKMRDDLLKRDSFKNCFIALPEVLPLSDLEEIAEVFKPNGTESRDDWFSIVRGTGFDNDTLSSVYSNDNGKFKLYFSNDNRIDSTILSMKRL